MARHLLIYDVDWWILGKHAKIIRQHHPFLDLMSISELERYLEHHRSDDLNQSYDHICTMCLGIAAYCIFKHIRIDASAAVSYYYFSRNYDTFREWRDELYTDTEFLQLVIPRIGVIGAMNDKLAQMLRVAAPEASVESIGDFVDHTLFQPPANTGHNTTPFVIGWAGDPAKRSKNYNTLYQTIRNHFLHDERITFMETAGAYSYEDMPKFYHQLDILLITAANEGSGATALEAYACGVPVLGTHVGNVKAAAHADAYSLILDSDDPEDFIAMIHEWIGQRDKLKAIGLQCRKQVESFWTIEHVIGRWLSVLFQLGR